MSEEYIYDNLRHKIIDLKRTGACALHFYKPMNVFTRVLCAFNFLSLIDSIALKQKYLFFS